MTIDQANQLFTAYQQLLAQEKERGARRRPSLLPGSKDDIVRAIRLLVARLYFLGQDEDQTLRPYLEAVMFLDSFTDDTLDSVEFLQRMQARREEVTQFYQDLSNVGRNDPFFWQRVYALTGITFETRRTTFFESIRQRLGVAPKPEPVTDAEIANLFVSPDR